MIFDKSLHEAHKTKIHMFDTSLHYQWSIWLGVPIWEITQCVGVFVSGFELWLVGDAAY